ncbi:hypothetical protein ASPVEDRAFT_154349 [Aspergillus versicolor CBS 583.65]|uniref:Ketoreductase (KR) domain-containing protein n=1 Tax=Aspergillus versicolor CBS 583.65 TaxID=1036611 RepID=A0A1L9PXV6_ASPVE|nr:uncharacterized protein ASPVEDRAFT_154349 [Aspergillus versicolor CBS 583.65]OJJ06285.1 hypothetical protein ASPVEDRAFT_154349 [Aspergillus versicolor CBS 583.65]
MDLKGAHVLITGGTQGVGEALVTYFLAQGAEVSYCAPTVSNTEFSEFHNSLPNTNTARAVGTALDMLDIEAVEDWVMDSVRRVGRLDLVIAKASDMQMDEERTDTQIQLPSTLAAEILSLRKLIRATAPHLANAPQASIVILGSFITRKLSRPPPVSFSLRRATQLQRAHDLIEHLGAKGIRVTAISSGSILGVYSRRQQFSGTLPEREVEERLGELGNVNELVKSVALLLSDPAAWPDAGSHCLVDGDIQIVTRI